jgi:hypothetical protein
VFRRPRHGVRARASRLTRAWRRENATVIRLISAALCAIVSLSGSVQSPGSIQSSAGGKRIRVLFVGNSLTTTNNLPLLVEALAEKAASERIESRVVAFPNYSLEDHWNRGDAKRTIAEGGWSVVVLQQGPSALPESRVLLIDYARRFNAEAQRVGARTALYMVWPAQARLGDFEGVRASYAAAAREIRGLLLPAGDAWRAAWRRDGRLPLYGNDGFHPSALGSYLAALVIYQQLTGRSPIGLPATLESSSGAFAPIAIPPSTATLLQESAAEANARSPT